MIAQRMRVLDGAEGSMRRRRRRRRRSPMSARSARRDTYGIEGVNVGSSSSHIDSSVHDRRTHVKRDVVLVPLPGSDGSYSIESTHRYSNESEMPAGSIILPNTNLLAGDHHPMDSDAPSGDASHRHFHFKDPSQTNASSAASVVQIYSTGAAQASDKSDQAFAGTLGTPGTRGPGNNSTDPDAVSSSVQSTTVTSSSYAAATNVDTSANSTQSAPADGAAAQLGPTANKLPIIISVSVVLVVFICLTIVFVLWTRSKRAGMKKRGLPGLVSRWRKRRSNAKGAGGVIPPVEVTQDESDLDSDLDEKMDGEESHEDSSSGWSIEHSAISALKRRQTHQRSSPPFISSHGDNSSQFSDSTDLDSRYSRTLADRYLDLPAFPPAYRPSSASLVTTVRGMDIPHLNDKGLYRTSDGSSGSASSRHRDILDDFSSDDKEVIARLQQASASPPRLQEQATTTMNAASAPPLDDDDEDSGYSLMLGNSRGTTRFDHPASPRMDAQSSQSQSEVHQGHEPLSEKEVMAQAEMTLLPSDPFNKATSGRSSVDLPRYMPPQAPSAPSAPALDSDEED